MLITKARNGDLKSFEKIYEFYKKPLYQYCYYLTKNREQAEDLYQDTFIKAFQNLDKLQKDGSFHYWIHTIARNNFINFKSSKKNMDKENIDSTPEIPGAKAEVEMNEVIKKILESLGEDLKDVLLTVDLLGFTYEEASSKLNMSFDAVRWKVRAARKKFIEELNRNGVEFTGLYVMQNKNSA